MTNSTQPITPHSSIHRPCVHQCIHHDFMSTSLRTCPARGSTYARLHYTSLEGSPSTLVAVDHSIHGLILRTIHMVVPPSAQIDVPSFSLSGKRQLFAKTLSPQATCPLLGSCTMNSLSRRWITDEMGARAEWVVRGLISYLIGIK